MQKNTELHMQLVNLIPYSKEAIITILKVINLLTHINIIQTFHNSIQVSLHCTLAAVQCIVIGPVCLCVWVGVSVGESVTTKLLPLEIACIDPHQTR